MYILMIYQVVFLTPDLQILSSQHVLQMVPNTFHIYNIGNKMST